MLSITTEHVAAYIVHRQKQGIIARNGPRQGERVGDVSNAEISRELAVLKRMFSLAVQSGRIATKPHYRDAARSPGAGRVPRGASRAQKRAAAPPRRTAPRRARSRYLTGWRLAGRGACRWSGGSVDFAAGEVRHRTRARTKNREGRACLRDTADLAPGAHGATRRRSSG